MRNLKNIRRSVIRFPDIEPPLTAVVWDPSRQDSVICLFGPTASSTRLALKRVDPHAKPETKHHEIASWHSPCPNPDLPCDQAVNLHYFADTAVACVVFAGGDIVLVREQPLPGEESIEIAGSVDAGIAAAAWSPEEELLAICTRANDFLLMSREFDAVCDVRLSSEDAKLSKHVSVGWGKAETQFKGKRAKALRDPTMPEKVDEGARSHLDNGEIRISWRGDGAFVAVNSVEEGVRRMIRVFSRDGILDSVSEPVDYMESALSWRPAGNTIASIQRREDRIDVVFFERNGLRHGEFGLRLSEDEMHTRASSVQLRWNTDSTVLAVVFNDCVQFWTMGNYHYYLKQEILLDGTPSGPLAVRWHPDNPLQLVVSDQAEIHCIDHALSILKGPTSPPYDAGLVAVIDGRTLKITPLRTANIPPPMSLHEVELDSNVVDAAFNRTGTSFAVLSRQHVKLYSLEHFENHGAQPTTFPLPQKLGTPVQLAFKDDGELFVLCHHRDRHEERIYRITTGEMSPQKDQHIAMLISGRDGHGLYVQSVSGKIQRVGDTLHHEHATADLPTICPWVEIVDVKGSDIVFGLTANGQLFADQRRLVSNCTSFLTTSAHLIFTTSNHLLKFVHLTNVDELEIPGDEPETDERCRNIERGARLATVIPSAYSLVLQMPRGNLETIYPRALVLAGIRRSISNKEYKKAFLACRGHRVDTNILYDYAPQQFLENVALFVKQVKKAEHVDLFLSQLREEDTAMTLYKETLPESAAIANGSTEANGSIESHGHATPSPAQPITRGGSKVNTLCDAFLKVLSSKMETNLQNIITAHVCKSPPDLEGGLRIVAQLRERTEEFAEKAAEHICFLADINQLYDYALGMYDLELAILIAQQSQKDPREYLPYLQGLQEMTPLRRQFTIDNDLGRNEKALQHLHALDAFEELSSYAEKHELHTAAIALCKHQPDRLDALMRSYADFLNSRNQFKEAAIAYEFLRDYASAVPAYRSANLWREALACASLLPFSSTDLASLARDLAEALAESKDYQSAATIQLEYLADVESAARLYCKAYLFADATRIVTLHRSPELLEAVIDPGIIDSFSSTAELLADCKSQLAAQVPRLQELRIKKEQDPLAFYGGEPADAVDGDIPDDISLAPTDASTMGTFMTRYTARTTGTLNSNTSRKSSKNRRREERKRAKGKKGTVYEEEYLVSSIGRLIERIDSVRDEVRRLVEALMRRSMREQALAVENAMVEVVERCKQISPEVFRREEYGSANSQQPLGGPNGTDALLQAAMERSNTVQARVITEFERLSLLG